MLDRVLATLQDELSDLNDTERLTRVVFRLVVATLLGAAIGYERERRDVAAGLRTHMLVSLGCAVFVLVPMQAGMELEPLSRVTQGVIAGIGFLGAGAVLKMSGDGEIRGLTTAASIWTTAAIGIAVGVGQEATAILVTALVLFILAVVLRIERRMTAPGKRKDKPER